MDWLKAAVESYKKQLELGLSLKGNSKDAIAYANENSTSGKKAREIAIFEMGL